jgi:dihydroorotate dehydrogenase electron transfer subunit
MIPPRRVRRRRPRAFLRYTPESMPVDVEAVVRSNTRLSDDYSVVALDAPAIAERARPGQFVMVKPARGTDPLLRRPFSIFEVLTGADGRPAGVTLLNKRVGVGTTLLYQVEPGRRLACLGPLGRPFTLIDAPAEAWLVAGGVGLAPFATLAAALRARGVAVTLFYGGRRSADLFYTELFERLGASLTLATEDGSRGRRGLVTVPLGEALAARAGAPPLTLYACGPTPMMRAVARLAADHARPAEVSLEQVMGCGLGGCYSCVVRVRRGEQPPHFVRSCVEGPVFDAREVVWEELGP